MTNQEIAKLLRNISAAYSIKDDKKFHFQIVAYQKAADTIEHATTQVADVIKEGKLHDMPGIGTSMKAHLEELVTTGKVKQFEQTLKDIPPAVFPLLGIPSFGPKKAFKLVDAFKLADPQTVINDIEKIAHQGKIATLEGFGTKSQEDILRAIAEFRLGKGKTTRMLLPFATELGEKVVQYLIRSKYVSSASPLGSLRRKRETCGDIDIAIATDYPKEALEHFVSYPYKERVIEKGPTSASILSSGGHQIDVMTQPVKSFGSLLQHFTGSKAHNVHLRDFALRKGLSLSEKGIKNLQSKEKDYIKPYATEEDFYHALGMEWIPPEIREDTGEIEKALEKKLPELVKPEDIKGDLHIHSNYPIEPSHDLGADTMEHMLENAKKLQYEYLGFSEHNPSVSKHKEKEIYSILEKRKNKIEQLRSNNKSIRVINLLETDILVTGKLAIPDTCFEMVDASIVSIHSSFGMDTKTMTQRVLAGLSHPKAKILAHPTGRLINQRPGYSLDWEKIFDFCVKNNKAMEVNSWPSRLDLPDILIRQAVKNGVKLLINTDSHATEHMSLMRYGVWMARRGWATKKDILNTLPYNEFIDWLKK